MQSIVSFIIYQSISPVVESLLGDEKVEKRALVSLGVRRFAIGSNTQKSYKERKIQKFIIIL